MDWINKRTTEQLVKEVLEVLSRVTLDNYRDLDELMDTLRSTFLSREYEDEQIFVIAIARSKWWRFLLHRRSL